VAILLRKVPSIVEVVMRASCLRTPRIMEQRCKASTPPHPGLEQIIEKSAIWRVIVPGLKRREYYACGFLKARHLSTGDVSHVRAADERKHVMFAQTIEFVSRT
jgi:hypothetical protein